MGRSAMIGIRCSFSERAIQYTVCQMFLPVPRRESWERQSDRRVLKMGPFSRFGGYPMKKRLLSFLCALLLVVSVIPAASALEEAARAADTLSTLGLIDSTYDLDATATRSQAAVLLQCWPARSRPPRPTTGSPASGTCPPPSPREGELRRPAGLDHRRHGGGVPAGRRPHRQRLERLPAADAGVPTRRGLHRLRRRRLSPSGSVSSPSPAPAP